MHADGGAFDGEWNSIEEAACFCAGCFCINSLCGNPCPSCFGQGKVCCAEVGYASAQYCGEKGCLFGVAKLSCCVVAASTKNLAIGCCDVFCCGSPYGEGQTVDDTELSYMEGVHWCCYGVLGGFGCLAPSPCIGADFKVCCVETKASTADKCWDDTGCIALRLKTCCCIHSIQFPPSRTLGCGCCCIPCVKRDRLSARSPDFAGPRVLLA